MTRPEFEQHFRPFLRALGVAINKSQEDYFFNAHQKHDVRDFAMACEQLAMGQPGRLPSPGFFAENIATAREMRLTEEKGQHARAVEHLWHNGPKPTGDPMEDIFAKCCYVIIRYGKDDNPRAIKFVREQLECEEFVGWLKNQRVRGEARDFYSWLMEKIEFKPVLKTV